VYREEAPDADPYGLYACVWSRETDLAYDARIVPDACVDLMWHRESGELFIAGPDTHAHVGPIERGTLIGLRFSPGSAPAALGVPADSIRDGRVALDAVWTSAQARKLGLALADTTSVPEAQRILEGAVTDHARGERDRAVTGVLKLLRSGTRVGAVADAVDLSERQLHRRCVAAFGYGPKVLDRVLRFDRALRLARSGVPLADIAYRTGFADQAHLSREVKALSGVPVTTLVRS
jgi:AraC-like DNA-binding protein